MATSFFSSFSPCRLVGGVLQIAALLLASVTGAGAQPTLTFREFPLPVSGRPGITLGPDGALWFTQIGRDSIGRITSSGTFTEFPLPNDGGIYGKAPYGIAAGPDGAIWFTELYGAKIGRITAAGVITEFPLPTNHRMPLRITSGPDGALWYTETSGGIGRIGRITTAGEITEYEMPPCEGSCGNGPMGIAAGPDGGLWFTNLGDSRIWRVSTSGAFTTLDRFVTQVGEIIVGPQRAMWFSGGDAAGPCDNIGRITMKGAITAFPLPIYPRPGFNRYNNLAPSSITKGRDGAVWFTASRVNVAGRVTPKGAVTLYPLPGGAVDDETWVARSITTGPDGALWIANNRGIVRASPSQLGGGVQVDLMPATWRNQIAITATGLLQVAVLGTAAFDVTRLDASSVRLEGVAAFSASVKDVVIGAGLCGSGGADGRPDLLLKFQVQELLAALSPLPEQSEDRVLRLTGQLKPEFGGKQIHGQDIVVLKVR